MRLGASGTSGTALFSLNQQFLLRPSEGALQHFSRGADALSKALWWKLLWAFNQFLMRKLEPDNNHGVWHLHVNQSTNQSITVTRYHASKVRNVDSPVLPEFSFSLNIII